ncbi:MAG: sigma factor, partial [Candidatus Dormibacteraceae bacterium]
MTPDELCDGYLDHVYRFAALVSRDRQNAEDLAQEAMVRAVRALPGFKPERGSLEAWL